jgi:anti-anti-sigma regulatory factor
MHRNTTCTTQRAHDGRTLVVTLHAGSYGSLCGETLVRLAAELEAMTHESLAHTVVVDLARMEVGGTAFLTVLLNLRRRLERNEQQLIVCGDRTGLLRVVGWDELMNLQANLESALDLAADPHECTTL